MSIIITGLTFYEAHIAMSSQPPLYTVDSGRRIDTALPVSRLLL